MIDTIDQQLIAALMDDSRLSLKALAGITGLSSPSVGERLRRLEERGVLTHYTVDIDPKHFVTCCKPSCASAPCQANCRKWSARSRQFPSSPSATK
ncbi:hypothetical protein PFWH6_2868 [Pseudomonas fluorescens WH6]|nr:hypothetical protein PFWH6_2868 [Pseudomonas fluorescens WH6]